jgi:diguanylate cyclase (GGDEF)-like protein
MSKDTAEIARASTEIRTRFLQLLDSLSAVRALSDLDLDNRSLDEVLDDALAVLMQHQDLERSAIFLVDEEGLRCRSGLDFPELFLGDVEGQAFDRRARDRRYAIGEGIVGAAAATGVLQRCPDCTQSHEELPGYSGHRRPTGALLCAPVRHGQDMLGVVNVYHPEPGHFELWHEQLLVLFCSVLGHLLASHRVLERLEHAVQERTRQLEDSLLEAQHLKSRYEELSVVDELTGLHNRRFFFPEADAAVAHALRHRLPLCLLIADLDHFKKVNDAHGHAAGDRVLKSVAHVLRAETREGDVLARFGGEEFVMLLPNTTTTGARSLAERIRLRVQDLRWSLGEEPVRVTISIGTACLDLARGEGGRERTDELVAHADKALYQCKYSGRNRVAAYEELRATRP